MKTERKEKRKEGKGRKRKIEKDRDRKDIGKDKRKWRSVEVEGVAFICSSLFFIITLHIYQGSVL